MRYMFRPQRAIFRQRIFKDSIALRTLSKVFLSYGLVIVINVGVTPVLRPLSAMYTTYMFISMILFLLLVYLDVVYLYLRVPFGVRRLWLCVSCVHLCPLY
jgi:hypothetical protein